MLLHVLHACCTCCNCITCSCTCHTCTTISFHYRHQDAITEREYSKIPHSILNSYPATLVSSLLPSSNTPILYSMYMLYALYTQCTCSIQVVYTCVQYVHVLTTYMYVQHVCLCTTCTQHVHVTCCTYSVPCRALLAACPLT